MEGWNGSEKKEGTLISERDSFIERFFSFNKISRLLRMRRLFEKKETFLEVAHINYPRYFLNTFWAETFFLRLQIQIFLGVPTVSLSFLKNQKERRLMLWLLLASTFSELACLWFATWGLEFYWARKASFFWTWCTKEREQLCLLSGWKMWRLLMMHSIFIHLTSKLRPLNQRG